MYVLLYCKGSKRVTQGFTVRRSWRPNRTAIYWPPTLMAVSVVSFSFSRAAQPEAQGPSSLLDDGFLYCILSPTGLQNSIGGPEGPFGRVWLSLPHLVCNFSRPQLIRAPEGWCSFPYHISSLTPTVDFLSWLSYIIVQRPLNHPLNLLNGMFDRHQAEITVMQFRGHSLPVHQSHFVSQVHLRDFSS